MSNPAPLTLTKLSDPAALDASESKVLSILAERFNELSQAPGGGDAVRALKLTDLIGRPAEQCRASDLAVAVHRLEQVLADERVHLPSTDLMDDGDAERHPGFEDVEDEAKAEERRLLALRAEFGPND